MNEILITYQPRKLKDRDEFVDVYCKEMNVLETTGAKSAMYRTHKKENLELKINAVKYFISNPHKVSLKDLMTELDVNKDKIKNHILSRTSYSPREADIIDYNDGIIFIKNFRKAINYLELLEGVVSIW